MGEVAPLALALLAMAALLAGCAEEAAPVPDHAPPAGTRLVVEDFSAAFPRAEAAVRAQAPDAALVRAAAIEGAAGVYVMEPLFDVAFYRVPEDPCEGDGRSYLWVFLFVDPSTLASWRAVVYGGLQPVLVPGNVTGPWSEWQTEAVQLPVLDSDEIADLFCRAHRPDQGPRWYALSHGPVLRDNETAYDHWSISQLNYGTYDHVGHVQTYDAHTGKRLGF